jgi:hypothetical protein
MMTPFQIMPTMTLLLRDYYALANSLADDRAARIAREDSGLAVLREEELASTLRDYYDLPKSLPDGRAACYVQSNTYVPTFSVQSLPILVPLRPL